MTSAKNPQAPGQNNIQAQWQELASNFLKDAPFSDLERLSSDQIKLGPLQRNDDWSGCTSLPAEYPFTRGIMADPDLNLPWEIAQPIRDFEPGVANRQSLIELNAGSSALHLFLGENTDNAICIQSKADLARLLDGVDLNIAGLYMVPHPNSPQYALQLLELWQEQRVDLGKLRGSLGLSPFGQTVTGYAPADVLPDKLEQLKTVASFARDNLPNMRSISVNAVHAHEYGGSEALELAFLLGGSLGYMKLLMGHGFSANDAAKQLHATISMSADLHMGIAKLRAARKVWARMIRACGADDEACALPIHARTSNRMLSRVDSWTNIMRNSTATLAAVLGGAQAISVDPFTLPLGQPDELARRISRNTQLVLMEECAAGRVLDPAGGSHYHESLTEKLAEKSWKYFQEIQSRGGLLQAGIEGWLHEKFAEQAAIVRKGIRTGRTAITGVNAYANPSEKTPVTNGPWQTGRKGKIPLFRDTAEFERVRDKVKNNSHLRPVFIVALEDTTKKPASLKLAKDLFATAGIKCLLEEDINNSEAMDSEYPEPGLIILCLHGKSDASQVEATKNAYLDAGASAVWMACDEVIENREIETHIFPGSDMIELLQASLKHLA